MKRLYADVYNILSAHKKSSTVTLALVALALSRMPAYDYKEIFSGVQQAQDSNLQILFFLPGKRMFTAQKIIEYMMNHSELELPQHQLHEYLAMIEQQLLEIVRTEPEQF